MEHLLTTLQLLTTEQLHARLRAITDPIEYITAVQERPLSARLMLAWGYRTDELSGLSFEDYHELGIDVMDKASAAFREFLHTLCTNLCAEKLMIEHLISVREGAYKV